MIMPLINVEFPANAQIIFFMLSHIFNFNFIDTEPLENRIFDYSQSSYALADNFEIYDIFWF